MAVSVEQFVNSLTDSGLMASEEAAALQVKHAADDGEVIASELVRQGKLTEYQARAICTGQASHLILGDYTILDKIGEGGMGQVFKALHLRLERLAAIKILTESALDSPGGVDRFYQEVKTAARLTHPNIVITYDASEQDGIHYLVMEYVEGQDLATVLREHGPLSVLQSLDAVLQTAKGMEYAHRQEIIHRDIKPGNLLLDNAGNVKILDMGLARMAAEVVPLDATAVERLTTIGQVMGTLDYMAPEQAEDAQKADHRSDIYSLGCTLFRLLTGSSLYSAETIVQVLLAHREATIPSLRTLCPEVPDWLDHVFHKSVAKRPEDRYQSMTELIQNIEESLKQNESPARSMGSSAAVPPLSSLVEPRGAQGQPPTAAEAETKDHAATPEETSKQELPVDAEVVEHPVASLVRIGDEDSSSVVSQTRTETAGGVESVKRHRANRILVFGILGILLSSCLIGAVFGIVAWVLGRSDLGEMRAGKMDSQGRNTTKIGMILGIVATVVAGLSVGVGYLSFW